MENYAAAIVVGLVLLLVVGINAAIFALVRRGKPLDFLNYRLMAKTLREAREPITRQYSDIDELARLVAP
ncbi:MAG: hypothetical protein EPO32_13010 [Anaerolineae bacterium]|nr:MAG: hypothetical protein EPO32_13010 [Anaerolineae bacterium]